MVLCSLSEMVDFNHNLFFILLYNSHYLLLQFVRWENSKRLLYGSLVCLSMDNFESFLFAIVNDRDPKLLKEGKVDLCFSSESRVTLAKVEPSHSFLMVETTAYFEAYRYVLEGLQEQDEDDLPFQRYADKNQK